MSNDLGRAFLGVMLLRASAPFSSRINAGTGGDRFLVPDCTLKAISTATPLQFLPHLAPGVVFEVVKDTIFAIKVDDVSINFNLRSTQLTEGSSG